MGHPCVSYMQNQVLRSLRFLLACLAALRGRLLFCDSNLGLQFRLMEMGQLGLRCIELQPIPRII